MEKPRLPIVIDPETGETESVGRGRVAVIEQGGVIVSRVVGLSEPLSADGTTDVLSDLAATGELRNS